MVTTYPIKPRLKPQENSFRGGWRSLSLQAHFHVDDDTFCDDGDVKIWLSDEDGVMK